MPPTNIVWLKKVLIYSCIFILCSVLLLDYLTPDQTFQISQHLLSGPEVIFSVHPYEMLNVSVLEINIEIVHTADVGSLIGGLLV